MDNPEVRLVVKLLEKRAALSSRVVISSELARWLADALRKAS